MVRRLVGRLLGWLRIPNIKGGSEMMPTWRQFTRFIITLILLITFVSMFAAMGVSIIAYSSTERNIAELVTAYGLFLGITGGLVAIIVKELFTDNS